MWSVVALWACSVAGVACAPPPAVDPAPDLAVIQTAYDRELSSGSKLHDKDLSVLEAKCDDNKRTAGSYLCQVTFMSKSDPGQRLYFDIVSVAREQGGWALKSGLCKR